MIRQVSFRLITESEWELSSHQDLISQRFDLISSHKKIFDFISQEKASVLILFHPISWLLDFISQERASVLILSYFISWKTDLISVSFHFSLMSFQFHFISFYRNLILSHLILQKSDFIWSHFTKFLILSHLTAGALRSELPSAPRKGRLPP